MKASIRKLALGDYDRVMALWRICEGVGLTEADSRDGVRGFLRRNPGLSFVAVAGGQIVGCALCGHDGRRGFIYHLAVAPSARRQGIGRALANRCLSGLRSIGIEKCHIVVFKRNQAGRRFWTNVGWVERTELSLMSKRFQ
jgi:putative acetyltransferase